MKLRDAICTGTAGLVESILLDYPGLATRPLDDMGQTALLWAATFNSVDKVRACLRCGAKVNDSDNVTGQTALHAAAEDACVEVARVLLAAGAKPNLTDRNGETPAEICYWSGGEKTQERREAFIKMVGGLPKRVRGETVRPPLQSYSTLRRTYLEKV